MASSTSYSREALIERARKLAPVLRERVMTSLSRALPSFERCERPNSAFCSAVTE